MTDRIRLKLGLLFVVHLYAGWVLSGFPVMVPISVASFVLQMSGVAMLTLCLVCSGGPLFARCLAFVIGMGWLILIESRYSLPLWNFDHWSLLAYWLPYQIAASIVIGIGLFRPRLALRCRRSSANLLHLSASVVFRQLRLCQAGCLSRSAYAPPQFALRHIFYLCTVVAVLLVARGPLLEHLDLFTVPFMDYVMPGLVGLAAIRASLALRNALLKCAVAFIFATSLGESVYWLVSRQHHSGMTELSLVIMGSLLVVRSCGYRLAGSERCTPMNAGR